MKLSSPKQYLDSGRKFFIKKVMETHIMVKLWFHYGHDQMMH